MRNKAFSKKILCLVVIGSMMSPTLAFAQSSTLVVTQPINNSAALTKDETVFTTLDSTGVAKSTSVTNWIHSDNMLSELMDKSNLTNIKNLKGSETPTKSGDSLVWKTGKNDIFYSGDSNKALPISVKIVYYLNDKEISAKDLAGKSGKVKIKIDFDNNTKKMVNVNGKARTVCESIPITTIIDMPVGNFSKITATDGTIIKVGNNNVLSFISVPGFQESLGLKNGDLGVTLANSIEVTADAKDFKLAPIYFAASPDLLDLSAIADGTDITKTVTDLKTGITGLKDNMVKLVAGSKTLADKLTLAKSGVTTLTGELDKNKDKIALITDNSNVTKERTIMSDSLALLDMDTSMLSSVKTLASAENLNKIGKIAGDYQAANIGPIADGALPLITKGNLTKLSPVSGMMDKNTLLGLNKLLTDASGLTNMDVASMSGFLQEQSDNSDAFLKLYKEKVAIYDDAEFLAYYGTHLLDPIGQAAVALSYETYKSLEGGKRFNQATLSSSGAAYKYPGVASMAMMKPAVTQLAVVQRELIAAAPQVAGVQTLLTTIANDPNLPALQSMLKTVTNAEEAAKLETFCNDIKTVIPLLKTLQSQMTPANIANLSNATKMIDSLVSMQNDLKSSKSILLQMQDALSEGNVTKIKGLIKQLPTLTGGISQLSDGANTLSSLLTKYNSDGILKLSNKVSPILETATDALAAKDEMVKIAKENTSFSGVDPSMKGSLKFVMQTEDIKTQDSNSKKEVKTEKKTFWDKVYDAFAK